MIGLINYWTIMFCKSQDKPNNFTVLAYVLGYVLAFVLAYILDGMCKCMRLLRCGILYVRLNISCNFLS